MFKILPIERQLHGFDLAYSEQSFEYDFPISWVLQAAGYRTIFLIGFALGLRILKFYEMWNCPTRQKSYVRIVSALVVRTHA